MHEQRHSVLRPTVQRSPLADLRLGDALTLLAVERHGSMTKAARELGVSPSQVSKTVARVQEWTRCVLFARSGTELVASSQGRVVLHHLRPLVAAFERLAGEMTFGARTLRVRASEVALLMTPLADRSGLLGASGGRVVIEVDGAVAMGVTDGEGFDLGLTFGLHRTRARIIDNVAWGAFAPDQVVNDEVRLANAQRVGFAGEDAEDSLAPVLRALFDAPPRIAARVPAHLALELAATMSSIVVFPVRLAEPLVRAGRLRPLPSVGAGLPVLPLVAIRAEHVGDEVVTSLVDAYAYADGGAAMTRKPSH